MSEKAKRLEPTKKTLRELFLKSGNQCAFPKCTKPMITEDGVFIGQICHIEAAEEGGERFNPNMNNEQRRHISNLMLMCYEHHQITNNIAKYSTETLKKIKYNHESAFVDPANSIRESASKNNYANINIRNSKLNLGGAGGKAPGAGGGGGGALGQHSLAGRGGKGGDTAHRLFAVDSEDIEESEGSPDLDSLMQSALEKLDYVPGAGGGGGGAIGALARAGDGGDGGDLVSTKITKQYMQENGIESFRLSVGAGGDAQNLMPGEHSRDGEDTVIELLNKDGDVVEEMIAKGGKGAKSPYSRPRNHAYKVSLRDIRNGFSITTLICARYSEFNSGSLAILGGVTPKIETDLAEIYATFRVVGEAYCHDLDVENDRFFFISLFCPTGKERSCIAVNIDKSNSKHNSYLFSYKIGAKISKKGKWLLIAHSDNRILNQLIINVTEAN